MSLQGSINTSTALKRLYSADVLKRWDTAEQGARGVTYTQLTAEEAWDLMALLTSNAEQRFVGFLHKRTIVQASWAKISSWVGHQWSWLHTGLVLTHPSMLSLLPTPKSELEMMKEKFSQLAWKHTPLLVCRVRPPYYLPGPHWALTTCKRPYCFSYKPLAQLILANYLPGMTHSSLAISLPDLSWREITISDNMVLCRQMAS